MKKLLSTFLCLLLAFSITACSSSSDKKDDNKSTKTEEKEEKKDIGFGDMIEFDNLEITFGTGIRWSTVENQFSDLNGREVFLVPVTVKNVSEETHGLNMFYYTQYNPKGTKLETASTYFDNTIDFAGDMLAGGEQTADMVFVYEEDGTYTIEFSNFSEKVTVKLDIAK